MAPVPPWWMHSPRRYPSMTLPVCKGSRMVSDRERPMVRKICELDAQLHAIGQRRGQATGADLCRGGRRIVRDAEKGDLLPAQIKQRVGRGCIAIAWLTHRADDPNPAAMTARRDRGAGEGTKFAHSALHALEIQDLVMDVT